jgi:hypothetical protein
LDDIEYRIKTLEISIYDIQAPVKCQTILMLLFYFCLMYQDINEQVVVLKDWMVPYLQKAVPTLHLTDTQRKNLDSFIEENDFQSKGDMCDLVRLLEQMPGWDVNLLEEIGYAGGSNDDDEDVMIEGNTIVRGKSSKIKGFFHLIRMDPDELARKGICGLDRYTLRQWKYNAESAILTGEKQGFDASMLSEWRTTKRRICNTLHFVFHVLRHDVKILSLVTILTLIRVLIPRLWLKFYLGGHMWPEAWYPFFFVLNATVLSFATVFVFFAVFLVLIFAYETNTYQLALLSGLINMDARCMYEERVLVYSEGMEPEESEAMMAKLPILDITKSKNAFGFWTLREYVLLDRGNERAGMQILITISVLLIIFNAILAAYELYTIRDSISPFIPLVIFDTLVMGSFIMFALQQALVMNNWMDSHIKYFNQAVHDIELRKQYLVLHSHGTDGTIDEAEAIHAELLADLKYAKKFLHSCVQMVQDNDPREALLFGLEVTPGSLVSSASGLIFTTVYFLYEMLYKRSNPFKIPGEKDDKIENKQPTSSETHMVNTRSSDFLATSVQAEPMQWAHVLARVVQAGALQWPHLYAGVAPTVAAHASQFLAQHVVKKLM